MGQGKTTNVDGNLDSHALTLGLWLDTGRMTLWEGSTWRLFNSNSFAGQQP